MTVRASVIVLTYNRSGLLRQTLRSLLSQRDADFEAIVVDNGSTDDTPALLEGLGDPRVRTLRIEPNGNPTAARNAGFAAATGTWVGCLDDDDLWAPDKLASQLAAAEAGDRTWAYTGCVYIDGAGRLLGGVPAPDPESLLRQLPYAYGVPAGLSSVMWRRELFDGPVLDEELTFSDDWELALRLSLTGRPAAVNRPLVAFRQHGTNASRHAAQRQHEADIIERRYAHLRAGAPLMRAQSYRFFGSEALRVGDYRGALRAYLRGARAGDLGSAARAAAVLLPPRAHGVVRRLILSDAAWLRQARHWVKDYADPTAGRVPSPASPTVP